MTVAREMTSHVKYILGHWRLFRERRYSKLTGVILGCYTICTVKYDGVNDFPKEVKVPDDFWVSNIRSESDEPFGQIKMETSGWQLARRKVGIHLCDHLNC